MLFYKYIYRYPIVSFASNGFYILDNEDKPFFYRCEVPKILKSTKNYTLEFDKISAMLFLCLKKPIDFRNPFLYQ